jgi:hypothetical protein
MNFPTRTAAAFAALTALFVAAPVASASANDDSSAAAMTACGYTGDNVFAPWGDRHDYALTPDGGFENGGDGWTLEDGAAVSEGNERFQVNGAADHQSLTIPAGGSATSPAFCVSKLEDVARLFTRTNGGRDARLKVEVVYTDFRNGHDSMRIDRLSGDRSWSPTDRLPIALPDAIGRFTTTNVQLRFTAKSGGDWQIDDIFIDPRLRY